MKKFILASAFALMGTFAFAANAVESEVEEIILEEVVNDLYCIEVVGPCGDLGTFCEFEGTPMSTTDIQEFGEWMCNN